jgi:hypothetical protein
MGTFITIFIGLAVLETIVVWFKVQEMKDLNGLGGIASKALGVGKQYDGIVAWLINKAASMKVFMWILIALLVVLNAITAVVFGVIINIFF